MSDLDKILADVQAELPGRYESNIAQIEAMIAVYRNGKATVSDTMYEIADLITAQFHSADEE
mgnify:CR=1 FL=1